MQGMELMLENEKLLNNELLHIIGEEAEKENIDCYVVGGWVRDLLLNIPGNDIDVVCVRRPGDTRERPGLIVASRISSRLNSDKLVEYKNFGTAQVKKGDVEIEFVGARKESYQRNSRKPIVEEGTLEDDLSRRDFTINAMAICLNPGRYGELVDLFGGEEDLRHGIIRTPLNPDITFSDDPLRMLRAVRFASRYNFTIEENTQIALTSNRSRLSILSKERIAEELCKILSSVCPAGGIMALFQTGLLELILPEVAQLSGIERVEGRGHKDILEHSLKVLNNVAMKSSNLWLRWAALLHDIGKPKCKSWVPGIGWTFRDHEFVGADMVPAIFANLKMPQNEKLDYVVKMVRLHMRPINLVEDGVTDSAVRRLLFEAGDDIGDLMILSTSDITSRNKEKVDRLRKNYELLLDRMNEIEANDKIRNFQPPLSGNEIMELLNLRPCALVGQLKSKIKDAILDGDIENSHEAAKEMLIKLAGDMGILPL